MCFSLVLSGANPGASIDNISFAHSDGSIDVDYEEAVIFTGEHIEHGYVGDVYEEEEDDMGINEFQHSEQSEETVQDVFNTLNETQRDVVYAMIAQAVQNENTMEHSGLS